MELASVAFPHGNCKNFVYQSEEEYYEDKEVWNKPPPNHKLCLTELKNSQNEDFGIKERTKLG